MLFLGIDPGFRGAMAALASRGDVVMLRAVPVVQSKTTGRDEYDLAAICAILRGHPSAELFAAVERLHPLPRKFKRAGGEVREGGGVIANFNRGLARGWEWMLTGLGIRYISATPQVWQRVMLLGVPGAGTGERSIAAARALWPRQDLRRTPRSRKDDDGFSDALLLADWARRYHLGGDVFAAAARG